MDRYLIFKECFPDLTLCRDAFEELCGGCEEVAYDEKGYAIVKENELRLLCVSEKYRGSGIGTELLHRAEELIKSNGYDKILAGGFSSELFIGVPAESGEERCGFWEKNGYVKTGSCAEMKRELSDFSADMYDIPVPEGTHFGFCSPCDKLRMAVAAVEEDWVQYFEDCEVFCGYYDGEIASFCIVGDDEVCLASDGRKTGSVGCVGTVPKFRKKGIGLKTVALAMEELKRRGCGSCFIHYTNVYDWYARLGCVTFLWECFYEKNI